MSLLVGMLQGQVQEWDVGKIRVYRQTTDNVAPSAPESWAFEVWVLTSNSGDSSSATISGGGLASPLPLVKDGEAWELIEEYASESALDAAFPNGGSYTITLSGGTLGTVTQNFTMAAKSYANIPYLPGKEYTRAQSMDAAETYQLSWNAPNATANGIYVEIIERQTDNDKVELDMVTNPLPLHTAILANSLSPASAHQGLVSFLNADTLSGVGGFGVEGYFFQEQLTWFEVHTVVTRTPQAIVGAWQFGDGAANNSGVLVFQANGVYFHAEDTVATPDWQDGVERGTYIWNAETGAFIATANAASDTNGEIGLSHPLGAVTITVSGNTMTFTDDVEGTFTLTRVGFDSANLIEGAWSLTDNKGLITGCLVFLPNNIYFHMEIHSSNGSNGNSDPNGVTGMERGNYSFNTMTGALVATIAVDTNLQYGLSDPVPNFVVDFYSERVMNINENGEHLEQFQLHRISNATVTDFRLNKSRNYTQTADNTAHTAPTLWDAWAFVATRNPEDAGGITISGGGIVGTLSFTRDNNEWLSNNEYGSEAALNAEFPDNTEYTVTLSGGALGTLVQKIPVGAQGYASPPYLTSTQFTDLMSLNPTEDLLIEWSNLSRDSIGSVDFGSTQLEIYTKSGGNEVQHYLWGVPDPFLDHHVPAHMMLVGGNDYLGYLELGNAVVISGAGGFGGEGTQGHHSALHFTLQTNTPSGLVTSTAVDAGLSGNDSLPLATPHNDGIENLVKYAFNMNLSASDVSTMTPGSGNSGLPVFQINESGPSTVLQVEFVRRIGSGLSYTAKRSTDLTNGSFTPMSGAVTVTPIDDQFERVTITEPCDPATVTRCFGRVEVTLP